RAPEADRDAGERRPGVRPHLAGEDDPDQPLQDRARGRHHVGAVAARDRLPPDEEHSQDDERREPESVAPAGRGVRRAQPGQKNSFLMRSGLSQMSDLRNPDSLVCLSWRTSVSICSSDRPDSIFTVCPYANSTTSRGSLVTSVTISTARGLFLYQMSTASRW